jgi:TusA-related sulfurtransferase
MDREIPDWQFDDEFDGGEETCGRVIINLHLYLRTQPSGYRVLVVSRDPGAPMELPAWCRMTRNTLVDQKHPYYLITLK